MAEEAVERFIGPGGHEVNLGAIAPRGERGVLIVDLDALVRVSSNPFFPYILERFDQAIAFPAQAKP